MKKCLYETVDAYLGLTNLLTNGTVTLNTYTCFYYALNSDNCVFLTLSAFQNGQINEAFQKLTDGKSTGNIAYNSI